MLLCRVVYGICCCYVAPRRSAFFLTCAGSLNKTLGVTALLLLHVELGQVDYMLTRSTRLPLLTCGKHCLILQLCVQAPFVWFGMLRHLMLWHSVCCACSLVRSVMRLSTQSVCRGGGNVMHGAVSRTQQVITTQQVIQVSRSVQA